VPALRDTTDGLFRQLGIKPKITFEGEEVATAAGLVAAGLGVSLLPDVGLDKSKIVYIPIRQPECKRVIGIAFIKERYLSPAASQFKQFVIDHFVRMESI
jgi:DNA-binding transcriptional LysR family regulator